MVFLTALNLVRSKGPDKFWKRRRIFNLAAHYIGRRRNIYKVAIHIAQRALVYATKGRKLRKQDMTELQIARISAGAAQHGLTFNEMREGMQRCNILLNKKVMAELAAWEPYSFKALTDVAHQKLKDDGINVLSSTQESTGVITRGMLKDE